MRKCVTAYQDDTIPSRMEATITGAACREQKSIARTTDGVIIFMLRRLIDRRTIFGGRRGRVSGVKTKAKWRRTGIAYPSNALLTRKSEIQGIFLTPILPMRQLSGSYA